MEPNALLQESQQRIQTSMVELIGRLLAERASESVWEEDLARIRYESEESWEHCNAFLFAFTAARFASPAAPASDDPIASFLADFVTAVHAEDADRAVEVWTDPPVLNPRAAAAAKQTAMLTAAIQGLRNADLPASGTALPAPYPREVWLEFTAGEQTDVIEA